MADIDKFIKDFNRFEKRLESLQDRRLSASNTKRFGELTVKEIVRRTRRDGFGVDSRGNKKRLKILQPSTIKNRKRYKNNLSSKTRPGRSNATATGQMLDSLTVSGRRGGFKIFLKPKRTRELSGSRSKIGNDEVAFWYEKNGRQFLALTREEKRKLLDRVTKELNKDIEKELKRIF